ncbi:hydrogenase maturation nickel metallochaperone HypA/HybF [Pseudalkalibacillus sp. R45]|uniref:hydrogenase maturation nickel metallochaperone HypA/HybF n=1 Tax=Pseudalkalibacillus sp. R45 TaxID=3457433 RepID=UPI003FCE7469
MHEVSLMMEILSIIRQAAEEEKITKITEIKVNVGKELVVLPDAMQFAFEYLKEGSIAESASLTLVEVEGRDLQIDYFEGE